MANKKQTLETKTDQQFIAAGLKAKALRQQLAITYLASQEIIEAMRALREGIPNYAERKRQLEASKSSQKALPENISQT